jgi:TRAP-type C4-dicarboxylate transport system permease small subunit
MKWLRKVPTIFNTSIDSFAVLASAMLVFLWALIVVEVITRALDYSILWAIDFVEFGLVVVCFLGAAWVLKKEGHVRIDIVASRVKPRTRALLGIITSITGTVICLALFWYGTKVTVDHFQRGLVAYEAMLKMATWPQYAVIAAGSLMLVIQFVRRTYRDLILWRMPEDKDVAPSKRETEY